MELMERYLHAIGQFLPEDSRRDTLAELRANLEDAIEERAAERGGPPTDADVEAVIQAHGHPLAVATRYLPQRYLIGPRAFPIYVVSLRRATPFFLILFFVANLAVVGASGHVGLGSIAAILGRLIPASLFFVGVISAIFAALECTQRNCTGNGHTLWDTGKLPAVPHGREQPAERRFLQRVVEVVLHCFWMLYVLLVPAHPYLLLGPGVLYLYTAHLAFAPVWHSFYYGCVALLTVQIVFKTLVLWSRFSPLAPAPNWIGSLGGFLLMALLSMQTVYLVATDPQTNLIHLARTNQVLHVAFLFAAAMGLVQLIVLSGRLFRSHGRVRPLAA